MKPTASNAGTAHASSAGCLYTASIEITDIDRDNGAIFLRIRISRVISAGESTLLFDEIAKAIVPAIQALPLGAEAVLAPPYSDPAAPAIAPEPVTPMAHDDLAHEAIKGLTEAFHGLAGVLKGLPQMGEQPEAAPTIEPDKE